MKRVIDIDETFLADRAENPRQGKTVLRSTLLSPFVCWILGALGIFGGISSLFAGLACVVVHTLVPGDTIFGRTGTALLIFAIPALLAGSIFVDEIGTKG
jgi:hypothetical protein